MDSRTGRSGAVLVPHACSRGVASSSSSSLPVGTDGSSNLKLATTVLIAAPRHQGHDDGDYRVLLVKRAAKSRFMAGAHVFPGGVVEDGDYDPAWRSLASPSPSSASSPSSSSSSSIADDLALRVAGVREVFEECGLLIAHPPVPSELARGAAVLRWRESSAKDSRAFLRMFSEEEALRHHRPGMASLVPWAHWITPAQERWRYDTRFYLAILTHPHDHAEKDAKEISQLGWFAPGEALRAFDEGDISLPPPTWFMLRELAKYPTLDALRMAAAQGRDMRPVQPNLVPTEEGMVIALPGDELHWSHRGAPNARHRIVMRTIPHPPPPAPPAASDRPRGEGRAPRYALQFIDERQPSAAL